MTGLTIAPKPAVTPAVKPRVLLVDDEEALLAALSLQLRREFDVHTALGGEAGLLKMTTSGPFVAVVSDMRMPGMSGARFLAEVRQRAPDTVRILLTGQADLESAVAAVNEGQIFRFLNKPIPAEQLRGTLAEAARLHALAHAERDLLENTLRKSLGVLTDVLALVNPEAFSCASRIAEVVDVLCERMQVRDRWQVQVAALLSQLGCVTLAPDTVKKAYAGQPLSEAEQRAFANHPQVGHDLVAAIPRMAGVAELVRVQETGAGLGQATLATVPPAELAAEILRVAVRFDRMVRRSGRIAAIASLRQNNATPAPFIEALVAFKPSWEGERTASVTFAELRPGMVLRTDLQAKTGLLLAASGTIVSATLLLRIGNFAQTAGLREPIEVLIPGEPGAKGARNQA